MLKRLASVISPESILDSKAEVVSKAWGVRTKVTVKTTTTITDSVAKVADSVVAKTAAVVMV